MDKEKIREIIYDQINKLNARWLTDGASYEESVAEQLVLEAIKKDYTEKQLREIVNGYVNYVNGLFMDASSSKEIAKKIS